MYQNTGWRCTEWVMLHGEKMLIWWVDLLRVIVAMLSELVTIHVLPLICWMPREM